MNEHKFELTKGIERYLAALSKLYAQDGKRQEQEIIVNSAIRVHEGWDYDNWNGGTYGHALYLEIPESIYLRVARNRDDLQTQFKEDINKLHNIQNEYISQVLIEMNVSNDDDWRANSGLLVKMNRVVSQDTEKRLWEEGLYRVFLSHKAEVKIETAELKKQLKVFGVSCFVAHEDIHPTREWQTEIVNALASMDALVALLTPKFHDSHWTDQEVGFAFGVGVPIISVKLGNDPYGFIGKFQALSCSWEDATKRLLKLLIRHDRMLNAYVHCVETCKSFNEGNALAEVLPLIDKASDHHVERLIMSYRNNLEVQGSFGFNGSKPSQYGLGLEWHLQRLTGRTSI